MKNLLLFLCSDGMNAFLTIGKAVVVIILVSIVIATVLLIRSSLPNDMLRRYPWRVRLHWTLPFNQRWRKEIAPEDIGAIRKFQRRLHTWELVGLASLIFRIIYFNILAPRLFLLLASGQCRN